MPKKVVLKELLIEKGLLSESEVKPFIMAGEVFVNGQRADSAFIKIDHGLVFSS